MTTPLPEPAIYHWYHPAVDAPDYVKCVGYTEAQLREYGAAEYKRALSEANVSRYADWMDEAAEDIEFWGAYASAYFVNKHKLSDTLADYRNRAMLLRKLGDHNMNQTPTFHLELNDDAVAMLDSMKQKIRVLEQACEFYDAALKASCPDGAKGEVFYNWNEARFLTGRSYLGAKK